VSLVESGAHDLGTVDTAIKEQAGFPMGPFELLDVVGNDVSLAIQKELYAEFKEPGFAPAPLLEQVVAEGRLGRKTKRGFHDYS
jgi:3-hydroxybutyryl-CoA dehydrogenase